MRYFLTGILIFSLLFQNLGKMVVVASFLSNQKFIAANLCENRAKPDLHCNGKCHLKKQIKKEEQKSPVLPSFLKNHEEITGVSSGSATFHLSSFSTTDLTFAELSFSVPSSPAYSIFHPPAVNC